MKKVIRLTESDLARIVKRVIKEQSIINLGGETDPKKTDAKTNQNWKKLEPMLINLGFKKKLNHIVEGGGIINIGGYPNVDYWEAEMTHPSGYMVYYPPFNDSTGDYNPQHVGDSKGQLPAIISKTNPSCMSEDKSSGSIGVKVGCTDAIIRAVKKIIGSPK